MRRAQLVAIILFCSLVFSLSAGGQATSSQTARQALLEMFFGEKPNHLEKHLPDVTLRSVRKLSSPDSPSVLAEFSMIASQIKAEGTSFQTFDTGPTLLTTEDPRSGGGLEKIELTVERDDLIGDEDQIELSFHMYKNGKEESLPVIPRFTFAMQSQADVWRLNEISVTVRVPLSDPNFLKTIEDQQRSRNEQMTMFSLQQVNSAEKAYLAAQGHYACSLAALGPRDGKPNTNAYLWDPQLVSGRKNGYVFVISSCDSGRYKVVAEPAVDDSGQRAFCSDESGSVRAAADGKAITCLSSGEVVQEAMANQAAGIAATGANPSANTAPQIAAAVGTVGSSSDAKAQSARPAPPAQRQGQLVHIIPASPGETAPVIVPESPQRIRVSAGVMQGLLITKVQPIYPEAAKAAGAQGSVTLGALIGKDGTVQNLRIVSSDSLLLNQSALDAVKQWKYKRYHLNGTAVEVETTITVNFTLIR
jgi:TonB family protein